MKWHRPPMVAKYATEHVSTCLHRNTERRTYTGPDPDDQNGPDVTTGGTFCHDCNIWLAYS